MQLTQAIAYTFYPPHPQLFSDGYLPGNVTSDSGPGGTTFPVFPHADKRIEDDIIANVATRYFMSVFVVLTMLESYTVI